MPTPDIFCRHFYASYYLPVAHYQHGELIHSVGFPDGLSPCQAVIKTLCSATQNPVSYSASDTGLYGLIRDSAKDNSFMIGPAYSGSVSDEMLHTYMSSNAIPSSREEEVAQFLRSIPQFSYNRFLNTLLFLHLIINNEDLAVTEQFEVSDMSLEQEIAARHANLSYTARDERQQHGTYFFERQMLEYVRRGQPEQMRKFLLDTTMSTPLTEGKLADSPLRQAKNLFIGTVSMIGKDGAIPGGMDIEQTYLLIDTYIQECERLQSLDAVKNLQFNMLIDFTSRVARSKLPEGISDEIFSCMQYIGSHLNESISLEAVASHIGKSRAYTVAKFKRETGKTIGDYITFCRMQEAKTLLKYTDKTLGEISDYLHFSSQPHFQNVFKAQFGITPARYRKRRQ